MLIKHRLKGFPWQPAKKKKQKIKKKKMICEDTFSKGVIRETGLCFQPDTLTTVTETTSTK